MAVGKLTRSIFFGLIIALSGVEFKTKELHYFMKQFKNQVYFYLALMFRFDNAASLLLPVNGLFSAADKF